MICGILLISLIGCTTVRPVLQSGETPVAEARYPVSVQPTGSAQRAQPAAPAQPTAIAVAPLPPVPIAVSPTGEWVATGLDGLTLVDRTGAAIRPFPGAFDARRLSWSPAGDWLLAATVDGHVLLLQPAGGRVVDLAGQLPGLGDAWPLPAWSPDGTRVLVTAEPPDGSYGSPIWEVTLATGAVRKVWQSGRVVGLYGLADDRALLLRDAGCCGAQATVLDLKTGVASDLGHHGSHAVTPDGRVLAHAPYMNGEVTIRDVATGEEVRGARPADADWYRLWVNSFSPDGRFLAETLDQGEKGERRTLQVIDRTGAEPTRSISDWAGTLVWVGAHHDFIYDTALPDDGIAVHLNGRIVAKHEQAKRLGLLTRTPGAVRSADGRHLAYAVQLADWQSLLVVADLATGAVRTLPDTTGLIPLTWAADGAGLIVAEMAFTHDDLPGGSSIERWDLRRVKVIKTARTE